MKECTAEQPWDVIGRYALFTDVSLNPRLKLGVGASLVIPASFLERSPDDIERSAIAGHVAIQRFEETSSTKLEVQTVIWALDEYRKSPAASGAEGLCLYTDSQCVAGLPGRRPRLERTGFSSSRTHSTIRNAALYRIFYELYDRLGLEVIKVPGHTRLSMRSSIELVFSIVDKESRKALNILLRGT